MEKWATTHHSTEVIKMANKGYEEKVVLIETRKLDSGIAVLYVDNQRVEHVWAEKLEDLTDLVNKYTRQIEQWQRTERPHSFIYGLEGRHPSAQLATIEQWEQRGVHLDSEIPA